MSSVIEITDLSLPALAPYVRLTEAQLRSRQDPSRAMFIAESLPVIIHALKAGCEPVSFLMEKHHLNGPAGDLASRCPGIPVYTGESSLLASLTGYHLHRGVLCAMKRPQGQDPALLLRQARRVAVLDGLVDPSNVGAIFRSAAALGMDALLLSDDCCDPLYRKAVRVSMGTVFQIPWAWCHEPAALLHSEGFKTAAMALRDDSVSLDDPCLAAEPRLALLLGNEGNGLPQATIDACDYTIRIPMAHGVDSLNVAAAAAVAFWELRSRSGRA